MEQETRRIHRSTDEARGGVTRHGVRWVLGISLILAIAALSAIWITGALSHEDAGAAAPTQEVAAGHGAETVPMLSDGALV
jgi:hypothetical protein